MEVAGNSKERAEYAGRGASTEARLGAGGKCGKCGGLAKSA